MMQSLTRRRLLGSSLALGLVPLPALAAASVNVRSLGAKGDGRANDLPAFNAALAQLGAAGGTLVVPRGVYRLTPEPGLLLALRLTAGIQLTGEGPDTTTLLMDESGPGHVVGSVGGNVAVRGITIDGNRERRRTPIGHGLRLEGEGYVVEDVHVINAPHYGMGLGESHGIANSRFTRIELANSGADGIDIKNREAITANVDISFVRVRSFGHNLHPGNDTGIDVRGRCNLSDITVDEVRPGLMGLRFRWGETTSVNGPGGHGSTARRIAISSADPQSGLGIGVYARDVTVEDFRVTNLSNGVHISGERVVMRSGKVKALDNALLLARIPQGAAVGTQFNQVDFDGGRQSVISMSNQVDATFQNCSFSDCAAEFVQAAPKAGPPDLHQLRFQNCKFDSSCRAG